jgi:acetyl-CoA acetyltransferase
MENLRDRVAVVGIGETEYVRKSDRNAKQLVIEAVQKAIADAGLTPKDINGITSGYAAPGLFNSCDLAYNLGIDYCFSGTMGDASGSNPGSFHLAAMAIAAGKADTILTYYTNSYGSRIKSLGDEFLGGNTCELKASFEASYGVFDPPVFYAQIAHRYMHEYGLTSEQLTRGLGALAVSERRNALLNGKGVQKRPLSFEDYVNSPVVATPLRRPDCTTYVDGACAWVVTSAERAKKCPHKPVYVMGTGYGFTPSTIADGWTQKMGGFLHKDMERQALDGALKTAGISKDDLDFAEVYDAFTIQLLLFLESLGLCEHGKGWAVADSGAFSLEGSLPVNTHGGHLSHSFLNAASHVVEGVRQLRGDAGACQVKNAKIGLIHAGATWESYASILRRG